MTQRRFGPPPHTQDPYTKLTSPWGIPVDQLVSVLQKDIRRGHVDNAVLIHRAEEARLREASPHG